MWPTGGKGDHSAYGVQPKIVYRFTLKACLAFPLTPLAACGHIPE